MRISHPFPAQAVVADATSRRVLTTEWVDGERLDETGARDDVPRLASLAMNSYMWMMLDSGLLHCDPHPGNLLRAPDGRLCILDWGLVTQLDEDLRLTLIEHVAHLVARDYAKVPGDLVRLGFVPEGGEDAAADAGVVDLLTRAYSKRAEGGGFANFDVPGLIDELRGLSSSPSTGSNAIRVAEVIDDALNGFYGGRADAFWEREGRWPGQRVGRAPKE